jgi:protein-tyrosine phosphatase
VTSAANPVPPLNFRDVGGLPTRSGRSARPGVLLRSDALYRGDALSSLAAGAWPPATVIDLRRDDERTEFDLAWPESTAIHHLGFLDPAMTRSSASLAELYLRLLAAGAGTIADIAAIAATSPGPVLVHCAAGKDRTGVVAAVLLSAAGVTRAAIVEDYLATGSTARRRRERVAPFGIALRPSSVPDEFFDVSPAAITAVLDTVDRDAEGPAGAGAWLIEHGADPADIATWTQRLVGDRQ